MSNKPVARNDESPEIIGTESAGTESAAQVDDPENYLQTRRIQSLMNSRDMVRKVKRVAMFKHRRGDVDRNGAASIYRTAVEDYISEIEPLALDKYPDVGETYWYEVPLGEQIITPEPHEIPEHFSPDDVETYVQHSYTGLESIVETPPVLQSEFSFEKRIRHQGYSEETIYVERDIDWQVLTTAVREANLFLAKIGFEIDNEGEIDTYGIHATN